MGGSSQCLGNHPDLSILTIIYNTIRQHGQNEFIVFACSSCHVRRMCREPGRRGRKATAGVSEKVVYSEAVEVPVINAVDEKGYTVYYVDSENGNDDYDGLSESHAFKTLSRIETLKKVPGMKVLLKRGCVFSGPFRLEALNGTAAKPFVVDAYGEGNRPVISGGGDDAVLITDDNFRFRNIKVTNKTGRRGVHVVAVRGGAMKNIEIAGCRFESVNWNSDEDVEAEGFKITDAFVKAADPTFNKLHGGVIIEGPETAETGPSWFENVFVTGNEFYKVSRTGIQIDSKWGTRVKGQGRNKYIDDDHNWWPSRNIVFQGNELDYIGGDGIVLQKTDGGYIDRNRCYHANFLGRKDNANVAMWPYCTRNVVMQFNEAAYTHWENSSNDGEGLDVDVACRNTVVQYNYVHHNAGGGILLCNRAGGDHQGTVVRNNVFLHNGGKTKGSFMMVSTNVGRTDAYNNIVVTDKDNPRLIHSDDWYKEGNSKDFTWRNNIFMSTSATIGIFNHIAIDNRKWENNLFFNLASDFSIIDKYSLMYDPEITVPAGPDGYDKALQMKPANARVFEDGFLFDGMCPLDMAGNPVEGIRYVGAFAK